MKQIIVNKKEYRCQKCNSTHIVNSNNQQCCYDCGEVLKENYITEETSFCNQQIVGQRYIHDSRQEMRVQRAHKEIDRIAQNMGLSEWSEQCAPAAKRIYNIADEHRFIKGRHTLHVVAACLYITCRQKQTPHLLIDFSDELQINLFVLGSCFLKLVNKLRWTESDEEIPIVDPSLYIRRYCEKLEFGNKVSAVSETATRIAARMKIDWISYGRRPASICGASILIAARIHNFRRTTSQIVQIVHVCEETIRKRIEEFKETPVAQLTLEEFERFDLETDLKEERDPPSFKKKPEKIKEIENINPEQLEKKTSKIFSKLEEFEKTNVLPLPSLDQKQNSSHNNMNNKAYDDNEEEKINNSLQNNNNINNNGNIENNNQELVLYRQQKSGQENSTNNNLSLEIKNSISNVSEIILTENPPDVETLSDVDDHEVDQYILTEEESAIKRILWHNMHKEWVQENMNQREKIQDKKANQKKRKKKTTDMVNCPDAYTAMKTKSKLGQRYNEEELKKLFPENKTEPEIIKKKKFDIS